MGTPAIISIDGIWKYATHFDGYPSDLGKALLEAGGKLEDIEEVAINHTIDFASEDRQKILNKQRFIEISKKAKTPEYTPEYLENMYYENGQHLMFGLHSAKDYPIGIIKQEGDHGQAYIYDLRGNTWYFRHVGDEEFTKMTIGRCEEE